MDKEKIPNNKEETPLRHYRALFAELSPEEVFARTGVMYDETGHFVVEILGQTLYASYPEFSLKPTAEDCPAALLKTSAEILIMRYLIRGAKSVWMGKFMSYRELPWGDVYDSNFNGRCRIRLAYGFGNDLDGFCHAAEKLGGAVIERRSGKAAADVPLPGGITVRMIVHEGDDEFPPSAQILFSDNVSTAWDAEDLAGMGELIISALKECKPKP